MKEKKLRKNLLVITTVSTILLKQTLTFTTTFKAILQARRFVSILDKILISLKNRCVKSDCGNFELVTP